MDDLPKNWEAWLEQGGIEDFCWYDLRHTFASRLVMAGVDLYTVSVILGHASTQMTTRYAYLSPEYKKRAVKLISKRDSTATKSATAAS